MNPIPQPALRLTTATDEETLSSTIDIPPSPLLVVYAPSESRNSISDHSHMSRINADDEIDLANGMQEASGPALDVPLQHFRVIYSPSASRRNSSVHTPRPSIVADGDMDLANDVRLSLQVDGSAIPPASKSLMSSEVHAGVRRRHNSTASNTEGRIPPTSEPNRAYQNSTAANLEPGTPACPVAPPSQPLHGNRTDVLTEMYREEHSVPVFRAFPEGKWLRPIVIARFSLVIVTCAVLSNFIYT
jgi:hypothetical protein